MENPENAGTPHDEPTNFCDAFLKFTTQAMGNCLVPVEQLPKSYRTEIERGISTGWRTLDRYLQGIRYGEMTVVTADTGAGKTTFCTQLMVNCAMQGVPVWINSWEMKPEMIMRKLASIVLRSPMKYRTFTQAESEAFDSWAIHHTVYINPNTIGTDIAKLEKDLLYAKSLGVKIVLLDHLDYLVNSKREKQYEAIEETVKKLHELAFSLSMHFILICHPRQSQDKEEVGMHMLKGSSSIKQYADNVIILHRSSRTDDTADPNKVKVRVAKNRMFGIEGVTYLFYCPEWDGYEELRSENE